MYHHFSLLPVSSGEAGGVYRQERRECFARMQEIDSLQNGLQRKQLVWAVVRGGEHEVTLRIAPCSVSRRVPRGLPRLVSLPKGLVRSLRSKQEG